MSEGEWVEETGRLAREIALLCKRVTKLEAKVQKLTAENQQLKKVVQPLLETRTWGISTKRAVILYNRLIQAKQLSSRDCKRILGVPHNSQVIEAMRKCSEIYASFWHSKIAVCAHAEWK